MLLLLSYPAIISINVLMNGLVETADQINRIHPISIIADIDLNVHGLSFRPNHTQERFDDE